MCNLWQDTRRRLIVIRSSQRIECCTSAARGTLTARAWLVGLVNAVLVMGAVLLAYKFLVAGDCKMRAVKSATIEHESCLGSGWLLEVYGRTMLLGNKLDGGDLSTEPARCVVSMEP